jgi:hypothetical protein
MQLVQLDDTLRPKLSSRTIRQQYIGICERTSQAGFLA